MNSAPRTSSWRMSSACSPPTPIASWNTARNAWEMTHLDESMFCGHYPLFSQTLPRSGMMRDGKLYELLMSEPPIDEKEFSFWVPKPVPLTTETAWMAGLFEGEGWISLKKPENRPRTTTRHRIGIGVLMTDEDVILRFAQMTKTGNVNGPYPQGGLGKKPWWRWQTSRLEEVERLLNEMWDGLCSRRRAKAIEAMTAVLRDKGKLQGKLSPPEAVTLLPTPTAILNEPAPWKEGVDWWRQSRATRNLEGVVTGNTPLLSTPNARDWKDYPGKNYNAGSLPREVKDFAQDWGRYEPAIRRWEAILDRKAPGAMVLSPKGNPRLNPAFAEWMLGLPRGWVTEVPEISRREALHAIGNGVCPQQCALALRCLLGIADA